MLYAEGGVRRFYQGLPWALLQVRARLTLRVRVRLRLRLRLRLRARARVRLRLTLSLTLPWALLQTPLTRFGDTAANSGVLTLTLTLNLT